MIALLAQQAADAAAAQPAARPFWAVLMDNAFALTLTFIFLAAIVTVIVQQRRRDKCLKFFHDHHVNIIRTDGSIAWGDLQVYAKGLQLRFDAPFRTRRGMIKTGIVMYEADLNQLLAVCRCAEGLTEPEQQGRLKQVRRSFNPGFVRRSLRSLRNLFNTLRDAFAKALSAVIGQFAKTRPGGLVTQQQTGVDQIGQTLLGAAANAYEPALEPHIGKPVVLELATPNVDGKPGARIDVPGYLVDYSDKFVAIFNVQHDPLETLTIDACQPTEGVGYKIERTESCIVVRCTGPDLIVVRRFTTAQRTSNLEVALCSGSQVELAHDGGDKCTLELQRTQQIDVVCSRQYAVVRFAGQREQATDRREGVAPEAQLDAGSQ